MEDSEREAASLMGPPRVVEAAEEARDDRLEGPLHLFEEQRARVLPHLGRFGLLNQGRHADLPRAVAKAAPALFQVANSA
jgi:hypothetical protein